MTELTWEKAAQPAQPAGSRGRERLKFLVGGLLIVGAVLYLIISGTISGARYFITVDDLLSNPAYVGQTVRISGAVDGSTIRYDSENLVIDFTIAHIPEQLDNLAQELHDAVIDPNVARVPVHIENEVKPDLLQNEAQAILTGKLGTDGVFYATELLLKCPSRYEESAPNQAIADQNQG